MGMKIKAVERLLKFTKEGEGVYRYIMQTELYNKLTESKVISEASVRSGISKASLRAAWAAIGETISAWATEGHSVAIPGLGTMRFSVNATSVEKVEDVASSLITSRKIIFTPAVEIKNELKATSIAITCYDRNGKIVKQVASADDGNIDNNAGEENGGTDNSGGSSTPVDGGEMGE